MLVEMTKMMNEVVIKSLSVVKKFTQIKIIVYDSSNTIA